MLIIVEKVKITDTILFLTVSKNKIAATPENIGVVAILTVVLNYSILFPSFTFFWMVFIWLLVINLKSVSKPQILCKESVSLSRV